MDKKTKALKFVEHIEKHLKEDIWRFPDDAKVMCKFCGKTIDEIAEEEVKTRKQRQCPHVEFILICGRKKCGNCLHYLRKQIEDERNSKLLKEE